MILDIEDYPELVKPRLYIARPDRTIVGELTEAYGVTRTIQLGAIPTIDFRLPHRVHKRSRLIPNPNIEHARNRYLIKFVQGVTEEWYLIRTPSSSMDESSDYKSIEAYGLAFELADKTIRRYSAVSHSASQVLQDALGPTIWSLGYVDAAFDLMYRSFDYSGNVLDFVTQIANTFGALIDYDSVQRKVNLYKFDNYGRNKGLEVSYGSLLKHATVTENSDEFYTRFSAAGAEGIDITGQTITGQNYIEDYSFFMYPFERDESRAVIRHSDYMSDALCHALLDYTKVLKANEGTYQGYLAELSGLQEIVDDKTSVLRDLQVQLETIEDSLSVANAAQAPTGSLIQQKSAKQADIASQQLLVDAAQANLESMEALIAELQDGLALTTHFSPELLTEWNTYIIEGYYENSNVTDDKQLMELLVDEFEQYKQPKIVAEIGIVNLLECVTESKKWDKLNLGDIITIRHTRIGIDVQAKMNQMTFDYENGDISLTISNVKDLTSRFMKDYNRNNLTSSNVISNSYKWNAAAVDVNEVQSVLDGVWDATKREITASNNETVEIGRQGIWLKDISDPMKIVVLQHGKIGLSGDGGNTWSTAIDASGVYAQRLVGQIIAGVNLLITNDAGTVEINSNGAIFTDIDLTVTLSDEKTRVKINGSDGIMIQKKNHMNGMWDNQFYVNTEGDAEFGGTLAIGSGSNVVKAKGDKGFWVGSTQFENAPFHVDLNGVATMTKANITGGSLNIGTGFQVNESGVNIQGNVRANAVAANTTIQAPEIIGGSMKVGSGEETIIMDDSGFYAGASEKESAKTKIDMDGKLTTTDIDIKGGSIDVESDVKVGNMIRFQGEGDKGLIFDGSANIVMHENSGMDIQANTYINLEAGLVNISANNGMLLNNKPIADQEWVIQYVLQNGSGSVKWE
ncbi:phage tail spike protein [Cohnella hashimotonis]|uniref:Phage tail spike protein n=1 Tax=Cohnella hashimotonis TaxID=2826895 RepID=A0ABT6TNK4_9BACL|nr:phage tail spike protein [Cohnella hashimotonis]MDI4647412.1 phage tail spike protein [Cohnella hashimotonis]